MNSNLLDKLDPAWAEEVKKIHNNTSSTGSKEACIYKKCQEEVFNRLAANPSQKWRINAIKEDLAAHKESSVTDWFAKEVVALAEKYL